MDVPADQTQRLGLSYIQAAQSLKHITHNEALQRLDALVHLSVLDRDRTAPPADPEEGDRHIVAAGASGGWLGQDGRLAVRQGGGWVFYLPRAGWRAHVAGEAAEVLHDGTEWVDWGVPGLNPVALVGINATADTTDRLSVKSPAVLLDHEGDDHRLKINKALAADTASIIFQTGYSGRAEFGLAGDDDWRVKVSADGSGWNEALRVQRASGRVLLPAGLDLTDADQAVAFRHVREKLSANRTYYVRTDGSDSNDGLGNTSDGAFLSLQKAMDVIGGLDCSIYNVTVNVAAGTYTAGLTLKTFIGSGTVIFTGDTSNPSNVFINVASGNAFSSGSALGNFTIQGFKWASGNTQDFRVSSKCIVTSVSNEWAGTGNYRIYVSAGGYLKLQGANNKISGGGIGFFLSEGFGYLEDFGATFTITANLTYSGAFGSCRNLAYAISLAIFTLGGFTVTGPRYSSTLNSVMVTSSSAGGIGGANHFPGNSAGAVATGGQYQ